MNNKLKYLYEKSKYYILTLIVLIVILFSSFFIEKDISVEDKMNVFQTFLSEFWLQVLISALVITITLYLVIQYLIVKSMESLKEENNKLKERSEIHNMRYGVQK
jgi:nucleoside recognition membrane protein YjiH